MINIYLTLLLLLIIYVQIYVNNVIQRYKYITINRDIISNPVDHCLGELVLDTAEQRYTLSGSKLLLSSTLELHHR